MMEAGTTRIIVLRFYNVKVARAYARLCRCEKKRRNIPKEIGAFCSRICAKEKGFQVLYLKAFLSDLYGKDRLLFSQEKER
ncbi:hypothetical protein D3C72_390250 [compost metagenome]